MRTRTENRIKLKEKVLNFLHKTPNKLFNISEISRGVDKASPTISKVIVELEKENKVSLINKKSMILVKIK